MKINVLVICGHTEILQTIIRLIKSQEGWDAQGAVNYEEAIEKFSEDFFTIVLIGSGFESDLENKLESEFKILNPKIKIIKHFGGGSGLLFNEIMQAIQN
jgi:hypothetical protein